VLSSISLLILSVVLAAAGLYVFVKGEVVGLIAVGLGSGGIYLAASRLKKIDRPYDTPTNT
jgi:hypothetical protein